jgi:hypothetical protein
MNLTPLSFTDVPQDLYAAQAGGRYLAALAEVDNPTDAIRTLDRITTRKQLAPKRSAKAFNPAARDEAQIFRDRCNRFMDSLLRKGSLPDYADFTESDFAASDKESPA